MGAIPKIITTRIVYKKGFIIKEINSSFPKESAQPKPPVNLANSLKGIWLKY
jgi:hypothetical protein